ncbi:MAG: 50S ribosomal protein L6 [Holosporaceae bacterium]|jgi:large subunit ribosomal protein L6|nr:50S ribosomal protein L6 [Holosporaceae bacterium]
MSRVGKHPINIPSGVNVSFVDGVLIGKGKNGEFSFKVHDSVFTEITGEKITFSPSGNDKISRSMWGTCRAIVSKYIEGLTTLFSRKLNLVGVGYRASVQGKNLVMQLGYSHEIVVEIPVGLTVVCETPTAVRVSGANRQLVGEMVKRLQKYRAPEPYKGKGVIIDGQYVYRKEGKKK